MKKRLILIDFLRLLSVLFVFLFHSNMHLQCSFSLFTRFISMGAIFMTSFFILSGFSIFYTYSEIESFNSIKLIVSFYRKRAINIIPLYWFIAISYPFWDVAINHGDIFTNIILLPIELL